MAAPVPVSSYKAFLGVALETTLGTAVNTPTNYVPIYGPPKFSPVVTMLEDKAFRGAPGDVFGYTGGTTHTNMEWSGDVFPDVIGFPLVGLLGEISVSGTNPYTNTIDALNSGNFQPPSYTVISHWGLSNSESVSGFMFSDLSIKGGDQLLTYTTKGTGWTSVDATKPTPSYTSATPMPALFDNVSIGGSSTTDLLDFEVMLKRTVNPIHTHTGSADASTTWAAILTAELKMSLIFESLAELNRYRTPAATAVVLNVNQGASARLQFTFTKTQYLPGTEPTFHNDGYISLPVTAKAVWNTTDVGSSGGYSPTKVVLVNAIAGGTYK